VLLGCNDAYVGSCLPTFRDSLSVPFPRVKQSKRNAGQQVNPYYIRDGVGDDWFSRG
jgi:hypothetical protein